MDYEYQDNMQMASPIAQIQPITEGLINANKNAGKKTQVEVGQNEQGQSIFEERDYVEPVPILKESYAAGQESQYLKDIEARLNDGTGIKGGNDETGAGTWIGRAPETPEVFTSEQALDLYNKMDPRLANDPYMASVLGSASRYYKAEGDFKPGGERATLQNFTDYQKQAAIDGAKKEKNLKIAAAVMLAAVGGAGVLAGGAAAGGGGAAAAGASGASAGAGTGAAAGGAAAAGGSGLTSAQIAAASAEAVASGGAAGAGSGWAGVNSLLGTPVGKFAAGQVVGLGVKTLTGAGNGKQQNPGLMNSNQNKPQPIVNNYYGNQQQPQQKAPKPIAGANAGMYSSGSGWGGSISTYQRKKGA